MYAFTSPKIAFVTKVWTNKGVEVLDLYVW